MRLLVGITSYGTYHADYLKRVLAEYEDLPYAKVLVFIEQMRDLPSKKAIPVIPKYLETGLSLCWTHRERFAQHVDDFDYFLYSEDDILITERNIQAWIEANKALGNTDFVPAFFLKEIAANGSINYPQAHGNFDWKGCIDNYGGHKFRRFANVHSACYMLSQKQLKDAVATGTYTAMPHGAGPYGYWEMSVSGVFFEGGLTPLVDLTNFHNMTVEHLSGKYVGVLGTPGETFERGVKEMAGA